MYKSVDYFRNVFPLCFFFECVCFVLFFSSFFFFLLCCVVLILTLCCCVLFCCSFFQNKSKLVMCKKASRKKCTMVQRKKLSLAAIRSHTQALRSSRRGPRYRGGAGKKTVTARGVAEELRTSHGIKVSPRTVRRDVGPMRKVVRNIRKAACERRRMEMFRSYRIE